MQSNVSIGNSAADSTPARQVALSMLLGTLRCDDLLRHRLAERLKRTEDRPLGQVA